MSTLRKLKLLGLKLGKAEAAGTRQKEIELGVGGSELKEWEGDLLPTLASLKRS